jgi:pectate lyase-like protein
MHRSDAIKTLGTLFLSGAYPPPNPLVTPELQGPSGFTDVRTLGAKGDGVADDHSAIQAAIDSVHANGGGVVWFPRGHYKIGSTVVVPNVMSQTIVLRGEGMRNSYLYPVQSGQTAVRFGVTNPEESGSTANKTFYCGMEDLSVSGSLLPVGGTNVGVELVELQKGWMRNVIIEKFDQGRSIGLHLRGSVTTHGGSAAPHAWRCAFVNVMVATSLRPLLIENGDENDFFSCNFGLPPGVTAAADSLAAVEITQGHNNRFFGLLVSGDGDVRYRGAYVGLRFKTPASGDNLGHQVYGLVAEGFNHGIWIDPGVRDLWINGFNSSISAHAFWDGSDDGTVSQQRRNNVNITMIGEGAYHRTGRSTWPESVTVPDGDSEPSVKDSDTYACSNSRPTVIKNFVDGHPGQIIFIRLDQKTTIAAGSRIRPAGNKDLVGADHIVAGFALIGGVWEQVSQSKNL